MFGRTFLHGKWQLQFLYVGINNSDWTCHLFWLHLFSSPHRSITHSSPHHFNETTENATCRPGDLVRSFCVNHVILIRLRDSHIIYVITMVPSISPLSRELKIKVKVWCVISISISLPYWDEAEVDLNWKWCYVQTLEREGEQEKQQREGWWYMTVSPRSLALDSSHNGYPLRIEIEKEKRILYLYPYYASADQKRKRSYE